MNNNEIRAALDTQYQLFIGFVDTLSESEFNLSNGVKWSAGQQLEHLVKSTNPLRPLSFLPKFVLGMRFGKSNRPSMSFDKLVEKYQSKLAAGGKSTAPFIPKAVNFDKKSILITQLNTNVQAIKKGLARFSELELDYYIIPHPLLGKLTLREMAFFTTYHCLHHHNDIKKILVENS
jgi:hypothetical protein